MRLQNLEHEQSNLEARMDDLERRRSEAESALRDQVRHSAFA
jgi:hypothetical protein